MKSSNKKSGWRRPTTVEDKLTLAKGQFMNKDTIKTKQNQVAEEFQKYHAALPFAARVNSTGPADLVRCACCRRWYKPHLIESFYPWSYDTSAHTNVMPHCYYCVAFQSMSHDHHMFVIDRTLEYAEITQPIVEVA